MIVALVVVWLACLLAFVIALAAGAYGMAAITGVWALVAGLGIAKLARRDTAGLRGPTR